MIRSLQTLTFLCVVVLILFAGSGCETERSDQIGLAISPNNVELKAGESQEFTASGWQDYTWEIAEPTGENVGVLSTTKGDRTIYTAISEGPQTVVLRVKAIRTSTSVSADPNNEANVETFALDAEAIITHVEPEEEETP